MGFAQHQDLKLWRIDPQHLIGFRRGRREAVFLFQE
jgi:hypothetical protein